MLQNGGKRITSNYIWNRFNLELSFLCIAICIHVLFLFFTNQLTQLLNEKPEQQLFI